MKKEVARASREREDKPWYKIVRNVYGCLFFHVCFIMFGNGIVLLWTGRRVIWNDIKGNYITWYWRFCFLKRYTCISNGAFRVFIFFVLKSYFLCTWPRFSLWKSPTVLEFANFCWFRISKQNQCLLILVFNDFLTTKESVFQNIYFLHE